MNLGNLIQDQDKNPEILEDWHLAPPNQCCYLPSFRCRRIATPLLSIFLASVIFIRTGFSFLSAGDVSFRLEGKTNHAFYSLY